MHPDHKQKVVQAERLVVGNLEFHIIQPIGQQCLSLHCPLTTPDMRFWSAVVASKGKQKGVVERLNLHTQLYVFPSTAV